MGFSYYLHLSFNTESSGTISHSMHVVLVKTSDYSISFKKMLSSYFIQNYYFFAIIYKECFWLIYDLNFVNLSVLSNPWVSHRMRTEPSKDFSRLKRASWPLRCIQRSLRSY